MSGIFSKLFPKEKNAQFHRGGYLSNNLVADHSYAFFVYRPRSNLLFTMVPDFIVIWISTEPSADKYSNKSVLPVSTFFFLISVVSWSFTSLPERYPLTMPLLILIHILSGAATAVGSLATTNISLKLAHPHKAQLYMAVFGLVGTITGAIAPMLGGTLADFFQVPELGITIDWHSPGEDVAVSAINLRALDFLFILAFIVGSISRKLLAKVR